MSTEQPGSIPAGRRLRVRFPPSTGRARHTSPESAADRQKLHSSPVQHAAATVGAAFGLVGLIGFLPGVTAHLDAIEVAGPHSGAMLFGLFSVSVVHNVVHLLFAITGLAMATGSGSARGFLWGGGGLYLLLALYGFLVPAGGAANIVPFNTGDNWLHVGLGVGMIALGFLPGARADDQLERG